METITHSVTLDEDKCMGCTNCIKRCPTDAIRVHGGKARIIPERCVDCGECIRVCPYRAKRAIYDPVSRMDEFAYKIALPDPVLYGQFNNLSDIDYVLSGLMDMGFDEVYEVSRGAELISGATRRMIRQGKLKTPVISSACPAVVRLIRLRFPDLCGNVLPLMSPMHAAAKRAKAEAHGRTGIPSSQIGAFFLSPCPARCTDARNPIGLNRSYVDGVLSISEIYPLLLEKMNRMETPRPLAASGIIGVNRAISGGEASALIGEQYLAADGMDNNMSVLEWLEGGRHRELEFIELTACPGGCVGGVLAVENPYVAKARIQKLRKYLPVSLNHLADDREAEEYVWDKELEYTTVLQLSDDVGEAIAMMARIEEIEKTLPALDCGSCGAPSCRALAEDVVTGKARLNDCVFILRQEAGAAGVRVSDDKPEA